MGTGAFPCCIGGVVRQSKYLRDGTIIIFLSIFLLCQSGISLAAGVIQLPRSGQEKCYDPTTDLEISCTNASAAGQDGYFRAGVDWPNPRFTNPDGTTPVTGSIILDRLTGLQWSRDASTPTVGNCTGGMMNWPSALYYVACLNTNYYLGHSDWRLPNALELESLVNFNVSDQSLWLSAGGFLNVPTATGSSFLSSTSDDSLAVWTLNLAKGELFSVPKPPLSLTSYNVIYLRGGNGGAVQLPRTGQTSCYDQGPHGNIIQTPCSSTYGQDGNSAAGAAWPNPRFTVRSGTVTDNLTGLIWLQDAYCAGTDLTWENAMSWAANIHSGTCGLTDGSNQGEWRLPNVIELLSLIDFEYTEPPLSNTAGTDHLTLSGEPFANVQANYFLTSYYLTSTTFSSDPTRFRKINFMTMNMANDAKLSPFRVWAVFDNRKRLTTSFSGTGSGTVTADCSNGCWYPKSSTASLTAIPDSGSYFVWWTGGCSGMNALTTTTMDATKTCTAAFTSCASAPIKNLHSGLTFTAAQGINTAYNDDYTSFFGRTDTLALLMTTDSGNLAFNLNKNIILQGGWDCGHVGKWTSPAFINGTITISKGSVVFDGIVIL